MSNRIDIITLFPEMFDALRSGITGRAIENGLLQTTCWNPRDYSKDKHHRVDDRPYGGGPGMLMTIEPLQQAIYAAKAADPAKALVIHLSPQGRRLDHNGVKELSKHPRLILVAGRYEGVDERLIESEIDEEWSIGDYVLSGGEFAAMVMVDSLVRWIPGALGDEESAQQDSFVAGLLDHPHYTRPEEFSGQAVPEVLMSGDHQAIARWRLKQALGRTWLKRPDLLESRRLTEKEQTLLDEFIHETT